MVMNMKKPITVNNEIWKSYQKNKDVQTRNLIMIEYLYLVKILASRILSTCKQSSDYDDIISCGSIALLHAIEKYDYTRDIKFETFASIGIRGAMIDYLRKQDWVPRSLRKSMKDIDAAYAELQNTFGKAPTDDEMAKKLEITVDEYHEILGKTYASNVLSLEELIADNTTSDSMIVPSNSDVENQIETKELSEVLARAIEALSEKERIIISLYYYEGLKSKQVASVLEVSESRISQLHAKALMKLKFNIQKYMDM